MTFGVVNNPEQSCTLTKAEFLRLGAIAAATMLTSPEADVLSLEKKSMLTSVCAIYHTELEKMMFPSKETETKNNDQ